MSLPIITGVVLTSLGSFLAGMVVTGLGVLVLFRNVSYNSQNGVVVQSHNGGVL